MGEFGIDNQSRTRNAVVGHFLAPLKTGDVIDEHALTRATLLAQNTSGTSGASATISPGAVPGPSDMTLNLPKARPISGSTSSSIT